MKLAHLLSTSPVLLSHLPARIFLFEADGSWIFRLANVFFFFFFRKKVVQLAGKSFEGLSDSRSTCTEHRMRSHCCPRRNQHCWKSLRKHAYWQCQNLSRRNLLSSEHEHGCRPNASPGCQISSALPQFPASSKLEQLFSYFFFCEMSSEKSKKNNKMNKI